MSTTLRRHLAAVMTVALLAGMLGTVASPRPASAAPGDCPLWATDNPTECTVSTAESPGAGPWLFKKTLHVTGTGSIDGSPGGITLNVNGNPGLDLVLDSGAVIEADDDNVATPNTGASDITINVTGNATLAAGSRISADNLDQGGTGGDIAIDVDGNMTLLGTPDTTNCRTFNGNEAQDGIYGVGGTPNVYQTPTLGARISALRLGASASTAAGDITINVGSLTSTPPPSGVFSMERCSLVDVSSRGSAGAIDITVGRTVRIAGLVLSESSLSGTGAVQAPGGGPITVITGCDLTVTDTGVISSKGNDPGADLVHLEACEVLIQGVVQSTGVGHALPNNPPNHCNFPEYPYQHQLPDVPAFTACVEIWGRDVTIDSSGTHNGNVNVDGIKTDNGIRAGWLDIFAAQNIVILGDPVGSGVKWAVSAQGNGATGQFAGLITILARDGSVTTSGQAVAQANATGGGSNGGKVVIEAGGPTGPSGDVNLDGSFITAIGASSGTGPEGGEIWIRSYHSAILGTAGGMLDAHGDGVANPGSVTLTECGTTNQYNGTILPAPGTHNFNNCLGTLVLPANATAALAANTDIWAACGLARISGTKWHDVNGDGTRDLPEDIGLVGWHIHVVGPAPAVTDRDLTTDANGDYFVDVPGGTYTICETLQAGWTQTFPATGTPCPGGTVGYTVTVVSSCCPDDIVNSSGNDFGNTQAQPPTCPEDPNRATQLTRTVKPGSPLGGGGVAGNPENFHTLQAAYDAAKVSLSTKDEVIGMFSKTTENVVLNNYTAKSMTITQCTSAQITAANGSLPVWDLTANKKLLIIGPDSVGGTIGWLIEAGPSIGHELKSIRSNGASVAGVRILTNKNSVSFNNVASAGIGVDILGNNNVIKSGTIGPNAGAGVHIGVGRTGNTLSGMTIQDNGGSGVLVEGNSNTIKSNKLQDNAPNGIRVTSNSNTIESNQANENAGDGLNIAGSGNTVKNNTAEKNTQDGFDLSGSGQKLTGSKGSTNAMVDYRLSATSAVSGPSGNKADGTSIPTTGKCTGFFTSATVLTCT